MRDLYVAATGIVFSVLFVVIGAFVIGRLVDNPVIATVLTGIWGFVIGVFLYFFIW